MASPRPAAATIVPTSTPAAVATVPPGASAPNAAPSPAAAGSQKLDDFSDTADWDWNLAEEADGTDFEIDADATSFYMPVGNVVTFKAKALNGTPPFTFEWDFKDGSPLASGEMLKHAFTSIGEREVKVTGKDASGATSIVTLGLLITHPVDFAIRMRMDEKKIEDLRKRYGDPAPPPAPAATP